MLSTTIKAPWTGQKIVALLAFAVYFAIWVRLGYFDPVTLKNYGIFVGCFFLIIRELTFIYLYFYYNTYLKLTAGRKFVQKQITALQSVVTPWQICFHVILVFAGVQFGYFNGVEIIKIWNTLIIYDGSIMIFKAYRKAKAYSQELKASISTYVAEGHQITVKATAEECVADFYQATITKVKLGTRNTIHVETEIEENFRLRLSIYNPFESTKLKRDQMLIQDESGQYYVASIV